IGAVAGGVVGGVIGGVVGAVDGEEGVPPQPQTWYRDTWMPCKNVYIGESRLDRREVYRRIMRQWHWRTAYECIMYSFLDSDNGSGTPRYRSMKAKMLLAAGGDDDYFQAKIFTNTQKLAEKMTGTSGTTMFLLSTGHSIHNERPQQLASAILDFVNRN